MNCTETVTVWFTTEVIGPCRNRIQKCFSRSECIAINFFRKVDDSTTVDKRILVEREGESAPHLPSISRSLKPRLVLFASDNITTRSGGGRGGS